MHKYYTITAVILLMVMAVTVTKLMGNNMLTLNDFQITRHFNLQEFASPDTNEVKIDYRLVGICEQLRRELDIPIIITSGYRTNAHNKKVGGVKTSYHTKGLAVDIKPAGDEVSLHKIFVELAAKKVIGGLGLYEDSHIHIDLRNDKLYWIKLKGKPIKYFNHFVDAITYYSVGTTDKIIL